MENRIRVVVYGSSLHMSGIATSLKADTGLEVICVNSRTPNSRQSMIALDPTVIAFDLSDKKLDLDLTLLRDRPGLLLIGIDPSKDELMVLSSRSPQALSVADLIDVIRQKSSLK